MFRNAQTFLWDLWIDSLYGGQQTLPKGRLHEMPLHLDKAKYPHPG